MKKSRYSEGQVAYVQSGSLKQARQVTRCIRAGQVYLNYAGLDFAAPFGGYKQSGNGRELGWHAFNEFLETKAVVVFGCAAKSRIQRSGRLDPPQADV